MQNTLPYELDGSWKESKNSDETTNKFGLNDYFLESNGLNELNPHIIFDKLRIYTGDQFGSHERVKVFVYGHIPSNLKANRDNDTLDEYGGTNLGLTFGLFRMVITFFDLNLIVDCAVDFLSGADISQLYPFVLNCRYDIVEHFGRNSYVAGVHYIIYEYECRHDYRINKYSERFSLCLTSSNTLIMRHYFRSHEYSNQVADTYASEFGIDIQSSQEPDKLQFKMDHIEIDLDGKLIRAKQYSIYESNPDSIIINYDISAEMLNIMQKKYGTLMPVIIDYLDIDLKIV